MLQSKTFVFTAHEVCRLHTVHHNHLLDWCSGCVAGLTIVLPVVFDIKQINSQHGIIILVYCSVDICMTVALVCFIN